MDEQLICLRRQSAEAVIAGAVLLASMQQCSFVTTSPSFP